MEHLCPELHPRTFLHTSAAHITNPLLSEQVTVLFHSRLLKMTISFDQNGKCAAFPHSFPLDVFFFLWRAEINPSSTIKALAKYYFVGLNDRWQCAHKDPVLVISSDLGRKSEPAICSPVRSQESVFSFSTEQPTAGGDNAVRSWSLIVELRARQCLNHDTHVIRRLPKESRRWVNNLSPTCWESLYSYELIHASSLFLFTKL